MMRCLWAVAMASMVAGSQASLAAPLYAVSHRVALGAPDRWDYVYFDTGLQRVFVAHGSGISAVDAGGLKLAGTLPGIQGAHGVLVVDGLGYASNGKSGSVTLFDPVTMTAKSSLPAQADADGMAYDPASHAIYVINGDSGSVTAIDTRRHRIKATIKTGGELEFAGVDGRGHLFVNEVDPGHVLRIDTATNRVTDRWAIAGCTEPTGLAVDTVGHRVFTSCHNAVMLVLDSDTGRIVASLPIGHGTDAAVFDARRHRVFSSNGEGSLSVIAEETPDHFVKLDDVPTARGARTMALDEATGRLFLVTADIDHIGAPEHPGGRPAVSYKPGSVTLLVVDPRP